MLHLSNSIDAAKKDREEKAELKAGRTADKAEDEKFLSDLTATHKAKTADYQTNQQVRTEELEALQKAVEILSNPAVAGNAEKHLPGALAQVAKHSSSSLVQLRSGTAKSQALVEKVAGM